MIIVGIKNGLGNQMFQFAFGKVLGWKHHTEVWFDIMNDDFVSDMQTDMDVFNIGDYKVVSKEKVRPFLPFSVAKYRNEKKYIQYIYYKLRRYIHPYKLVLEKSASAFVSLFNDLNLSRNYYFMGHWMNVKYFRGYEDKIREMFTLKDKTYYTSDIALEIVDNHYESVSLHIRRGDYLTTGFISVIEQEYYYKAIEIIKTKVSNPHLFVFTNDPKWVKSEFKTDLPMKIVTGNKGADSYKDMVLMSLCKHNIIANSSFSWWGAWLNRNENKHVICPLNWYSTEKLNVTVAEMIPEDWMRI